MPIINPTKLPQELIGKYSIVSNALKLDLIKNAELDKYDGKPKDEINVEIGDTKQTEFYPQIKLMRWTNETNFSVRLKDTEYEKAKVSTLQDKIIWDKDNIKIEFYDFAEGEGGYKMVWYLKEKPLTNKIEFTIQSKGLDFFYQPELTEKEKEDGCIRPENVVGSYAVYHSTKGGMNDVYGKDYKVGKAFHIFRPKIIDAEGKETWGILHIENGIYSVEIPQDFLDKAVYPIKSNDWFGYNSDGASAADIATALLDGSNRQGNGGYSPTQDGTLDNIKIRLKMGSNNDTIDVSCFLNIENTTTDSHIQVKSIESLELSITTTYDWYTFTANNDSVFSATVYLLSSLANGADITNVSDVLRQAFDSTAPNRTRYFESRIGSTGYTLGKENPWTETDTTDTNSYSIYATYTPSGGGTNMQINIGDLWKSVSAISVNVGDSWKSVTHASVNISDSWKTIF